MHTSKKEFECFKCTSEFESKAHLESHYLSKHVSKTEFKCETCEYTVNTEAQLRRHILSKHSNITEDEFNCIECDYQGTNNSELTKHIKLKHRIICRNCGKDFRFKSDLMTHRKLEHRSSIAPCRNNISGNCKFSADECWWNHSEEMSMNIECYFCELVFRNRGEVMIHRRTWKNSKAVHYRIRTKLSF